LTAFPQTHPLEGFVLWKVSIPFNDRLKEAVDVLNLKDHHGPSIASTTASKRRGINHALIAGAERRIDFCGSTSPRTNPDDTQITTNLHTVYREKPLLIV